MAEKEVIEVFVSEVDGSVTGEAIGFEGNLCARELERIIGKIGKTRDLTKKSEYYKQDVRVERVGRK